MVKLRPLRPEDAETLARADTEPDFAGEFNWVGYRDSRLAKQIAEGRTLNDNGGMLAVESAGQLIGAVVWHEQGTGPGPASKCWDIGIFLVAEHRGRGYGSAAQRALAEYLFAHSPAVRVEASTEVDNCAEQRALERAGFTREGVLRQASFRAGAWRDMAMYSILRSEL